MCWQSTPHTFFFVPVTPFFLHFYLFSLYSVRTLIIWRPYLFSMAIIPFLFGANTFFLRRYEYLAVVVYARMRKYQLSNLKLLARKKRFVVGRTRTCAWNHNGFLIHPLNHSGTTTALITLMVVANNPSDPWRLVLNMRVCPCTRHDRWRQALFAIPGLQKD